jgi:CheY-like chemotaxis protein
MASKRVLVVEDDPFLLSYLAKFIAEETGHPYAMATNGREALGYLRKEASCVALVITDVRMATETDGLELAEKIYQVWPQIPVLVTSGRAPGRTLPPNASFIRKPWDPEDISARVTELLHGWETGRFGGNSQVSSGHGPTC